MNLLASMQVWKPHLSNLDIVGCSVIILVKLFGKCVNDNVCVCEWGLQHWHCKVGLFFFLDDVLCEQIYGNYLHYKLFRYRQHVYSFGNFKVFEKINQRYKINVSQSCFSRIFLNMLFTLCIYHSLQDHKMLFNLMI